MKSKFLSFDLAVCLLWILFSLCGRYCWNQPSTMFLCLLILLRLTVAFSLKRREKKTWIPLAVHTIATCWLMKECFFIYDGMCRIGEYFFHVTGWEHNRFVDVCIVAAIWLWIVVMPIIYYLALLFRHNLEDTGMKKSELCGSILWHDRHARYFCSVAMLAIICLTAGVEMNQRFCQIMCFIAPSLFYWIVCRFINVKTEKVWLIAVGSICFWYAQCLGGLFRVIVLMLSFILTAYSGIILYKSTKSHVIYIASILVMGIVFPVFSIGYNPYACINYPRSGFGSLRPYRGILYISDTTNGNLVGLRSRYGLLVEPEYEHIRPGLPTEWGGISAYKLQKNGYSMDYDIHKNEILPSGRNPELQSQLCNILENYFCQRETDLADKGEIQVTSVDSGKTIGHVKVLMHGIPIWIYEDSDFLPEDTSIVMANEFLRTDSVWTAYDEQKDMLSYSENIPNDDIAKYKVYVRLALDEKPNENDLISIVDQVKKLNHEEW